MYYPERGREPYDEPDRHQDQCVKKCTTPKGDENCQHLFQTVFSAVLRNVLPRKGTRILSAEVFAVDIHCFNVKKCITPRGNKNLLKGILSPT